MITIENLTELEKQVLQAIADSMYAEKGFSDVGATEISQKTGIAMKQIRGVIASLIKKGHVAPLEDRSDEWGYKANDSSWESIIYLSGYAIGLVSKWCDEDTEEAFIQ